MTPAPPVPAPQRRRALQLCTLLLTLLVSALAVATPGSTAALTARLTNTNATAATAPYFTCAAAYTASTPGFYYKLDETSGTVATDSSANGRNGTYTGTVTRGVSGACVRDTGTAVTFDGSTGYVSYATSLSSSTTYSTEAWLRTTTDRGGLVSALGASSLGPSTSVDRVLYLTGTGRVVFGVNNAAKTTVTSPAAVNDGAWHHVMATAGPSGLQLYVDGVSVASSTAVISTSFPGYLRVGYDNLSGWPSAPTSNFLAASVDEVAVYGRTLTAADALAHYTSGRR